MKLLLKNIIVTILTWEARLVLKRYKPKIVAITGSVGKTSTKDAIWTVLTPHFHVRKSDKSFNSEIGLPLTILGLPNGWNNPFIWLQNIIRGFLLVFLPTGNLKLVTGNYPSWLILEVGADRPGDIEKVSKWLSPDVVVITRFSEVPAHIEFFKSRDEVIKEKSFLAKALKDGGLLLLNNDDADVRAIRDTRRNCRAITYSMEQESDFQASNLETAYSEKEGREILSGITFKVNYAGNSVPIHLSGTLGRQHVYPVLAALSLGNTLGFNMVGMTESIKTHKTPSGRMKIISGVKHTTIIDDSYNASPVAVAVALETLKEIKTTGPSAQGLAQDDPSKSRGRKIAVLGDMLELGKHSGREHEKAGREAKEACDILVTVGVRARDIAKGALDHGMDENHIFQFDTSAEAAKPVEQLLKEGDIILIKGSQIARTERIVEEVMAHPEDKEKLLVRQETEWQNR